MGLFNKERARDAAWLDRRCVFCGKIEPPSYPAHTTSYRGAEELGGKYHEQCLVKEVLRLKKNGKEIH